MIEKYNYVGAYYWVYMSTVFFYRVNKIPLDGQVLKIALEYLEKGAELGSSGAQIELGELYLKGKYVVQDTIKGKELYAKGWGIPVEKLNPFWR
jgi:TPR repeat protein